MAMRRRDAERKKTREFEGMGGVRGRESMTYGGQHPEEEHAPLHHIADWAS
jgi:hypothetical protein